MKEKPIKEIGFDEFFKILTKHFFSEFSKVITDFEITKLPKKADVLVIETKKPLNKYFRIFSYFRKLNDSTVKMFDFKNQSTVLY